MDKIQINGTGNLFITLNYYKENFKNHPTAKFLDPSKNKTVGINKYILDHIKKNF